MNISKKNIEDLTAVVTLTISKEDYQERVEKVLADYRKKVRIDGFRPGKVPASLVQKMYGKPVLVEEINKIINESIDNYISTEKIEILGQPIPSENSEKSIDWENDSEFEFSFELGLQPNIDAELTKKISIPYYEIEQSDKLVQDYIDNYTRRFGSFSDSDVIEEGAMIKGNFAQLDASGNVVEGGIQSDDQTIYLDFMKDEDAKKKFLGAKKGDTIDFDLKKAYPNDYELKNILKVEKEVIESLDSQFRMTITGVSKFVKHAIDQELFDKAFPEGGITTEEEFKVKITENIAENLSKDSDYRFMMDAKTSLLKHYEIALPYAFLKKWLIYSNEGKVTEEQLDKEYPMFENDLKWQLIKNKIASKYEVKLDEKEVVEYAKKVAAAQFAQYGLNNVPAEHLENYALEMLKREKDARNIIDKASEEKVFAIIKENVKLATKKITTEEFDKLFEADEQK